MDNATIAKALIRCLDLTSLSDNDTDETIKRLCAKAVTKHGNVAAVCVYPKFVKLAKELLENTGIKIATVVNFPKGEINLDKLQKEIKEAIRFGADEIDAVLPYNSLLKGDVESCENFLKTAVEEAKKHCLKIIIESGELKTSSMIKKASELCLKHGVDFIKTSTGKTKTSATADAANAILETILQSRNNAGFKASGGIKTFSDAKQYLTLADMIMGAKWVCPNNFRIGASSLLDDLILIIERGH